MMRFSLALFLLPFVAALSAGCETAETPEEPRSPGSAGFEEMTPPGEAPQGTAESPFGQPPPEEEERRRQPGDPAAPGGY